MGQLTVFVFLFWNIVRVAINLVKSLRKMINLIEIVPIFPSY